MGPVWNIKAFLMVLLLKEEEEEEERERVSASYERLGIKMQPAKMPEAFVLEKKKIEMMFQDKDEDHILLWYAGTVLSATTSEEGILA